MNPGPIVKAELNKRGLKYTFVSEKTGISYISLLQYLSGKRIFPEVKLRALCLTFGIDLKSVGLDDINYCQKNIANA